MFTVNDRIHLSIQLVIVSLAVTANIILLIVIKNRTPKKMRVFSIFLANNAIVDLISALAGGAPAIQAVLHNLSSWLLLLTFIYRLYILKVSHPYRHVNVVIWILCIASSAPALLQMYLYFSVAGNVPVGLATSLNISGYSVRTFPKADSPEGSATILPTGLVSPACMLGSCIVRVFLERYLKSHKDHSHHRSAIRTLTYQMLLPLGSLIGSTYWFIDMTYQLHAEWPGRMLMIINCSIYLASPVINILCLPPYRRSLTGWKITSPMSQTTAQ